MFYTTQPGGFYGGGMGNEGAMRSPAVRFDPSQLNVPPSPGYLNAPGYSPFREDQDRDRFILHNPRSGVAGNPFGADFVVPGQRPNPGAGPQLNPLQQPPARVFPRNQPGREGAIDVQFRQAMNLPGAAGNLGGIANQQFFYGPQYGQVPAGFQNKMVS